jgi:hypothetical protein
VRRAILIGASLVLLGALPAAGQIPARESYAEGYSRPVNPLRGGRMIREEREEEAAPAPQPPALWQPHPWHRPADYLQRRFDERAARGPRPADILQRRYEDAFLAPPR